MITPTALLHFRFNAAGLFFCLQAGISAAEPRGILTPGVSNAIVLMTYPPKRLRTFWGIYHKYWRSPRVETEKRNYKILHKSQSCFCKFIQIYLNVKYISQFAVDRLNVRIYNAIIRCTSDIFQWIVKNITNEHNGR